MLTALSPSGALIVSVDTSREAGPFRCPGCEGPVVYRSGSHVMAHFAHKAGTAPDYCDRVAESLEHERIKLAIFEAAREAGITFAQPEYKIPGHIIDVALIGKAHKVAVEVQISPMKLEDIKARVAGHAAAGFKTLWVIKPPEAEEGPDEKYRNPAFQRDIHELGLGALFVHRSGLLFDVIHLMGYAHVTMFFMKQSFRPLHLFDLDFTSASVVVPKAADRWWERLTRWERAETPAITNPQNSYEESLLRPGPLVTKT